MGKCFVQFTIEPFKALSKSMFLFYIRAKIPNTAVNPNSYAMGKNLNFNYLTLIIYMSTSLETKTSLDIDDLNTKVLKKVAENVSIPLAHIINLSFETGILPERLKISCTFPLFKAGSTINLSNYRPISCLPTIPKIFERIVAKQLLSFVESNVSLCFPVRVPVWEINYSSFNSYC